MRKNHTGAVYGAVSVGTPDPLDPRRWTIHWACCGRDESVPHARLAYMAHEPPRLCKRCYRAGGYAAWTSAPKPPTPASDLSATEGIVIPGRGFWPFLHGPMGSRNGRSGCSGKV